MKHRHAPIPELTKERCFSGTVPFPVRHNQSAHGWVTIFQTCRCGFERRINVNQQHREIGMWHNPDDGPDMK